MAGTIGQFLDYYSQEYDFNKKIGTLAKSIAIQAMHEFFKNEKLKFELKKCENMTQMKNTIAQMTKELDKERTGDEMEKFAINFHKLAKMARL